MSTTLDSGSTLTSSSSSYVSPMVVSYSPDAYINVNSEQVDQVVITGIRHTFTKTLAGADRATLLNAFKIDGFSVDRRQNRNDPVAITAGMCSMVENAVYDTAFKTLISDAITTNAKDTNNRVLDKYLADQLYGAFIAAFPVLAATVTGTTSFGSTVDGVTIGGVTAQSSSSITDPATDALDSIATTYVGTTTTVNGFSVDVITNGTSASDSLWTNHKDTTGAIASLYRQVPRTTYSKYYIAADASSSAVPLVTNSLPLLLGDKLSFVFDIDVKSAGANPNTYLAEDIPSVSNQSGSYGTFSYGLNMANRRVAFEFTLGGATDGATYTSGATVPGLRLEPSSSDVGTYEALVNGTGAGSTL